MLTKDDLQKVTELVSSVDVFTYQSVGGAFGNMYSTESILSLTKQSCENMSFPSIYFNVYTPEINYLRFIGCEINAFSDYHDINLLNNFILNPDGCYQKSLSQQYQSNDYYCSEELLISTNKSLFDLKEQEQHCDVKVTDFIAQYWSKERLFFSMNHPSNKVINHMVSQINQLLSIPQSNSQFDN